MAAIPMKRDNTDELPELLTVPEAAEYLRVGRSTAYDLCNQWLATDGAEGLPCLRLGRSIRVMRRQLQDRLGIEPAA